MGGFNHWTLIELIENTKGTTNLRLLISQAEQESIQNIKATVPSITVQSCVDTENNMKEVILDYPSTSDPRKDIFQYAVENNWVIYEMSASKNNLESIGSLRSEISRSKIIFCQIGKIL